MFVGMQKVIRPHLREKTGVCKCVVFHVSFPGFDEVVLMSAALSEACSQPFDACSKQRHGASLHSLV